ncbi:ABC transporter permease [Gemmobacter serpentinus]|uniref:ABC transporter permease n=1 Tax=Gemmobacter serpentinus TaxID=2652247 RepID=UPI00124F4833|nr:ABC transporter permease [Gemmobacter serpentinus]
MTQLSLRNPLTIRIAAFVALVVLVAVIFHATAPNFLSMTNITAIFRHMSASGVAALGLTFVIVVSRFDLSFPGIASFGAMTMGMLIVLGYPLWLAIFLAVAAGTVLGLINGVAIGYFNLPDIVTTIAVGSVALGLSFLYSGGMTLSDNFMMSGILDVNDAKILGISGPVFIMVMLYLAAGIVLHASRFGRGLYATGENAVSAHYSGIRVKALMAFAFVMCGALACWAAVMLSAQSGRSDVTAGNGFLMPAYASVFLGAALFGRPSAPATFAGALLISIILNGCTLLAIPYYYSDAIISAILITAIAIFDPRIVAALRRVFAGRGTPRHSKEA